MKKIYITKTDFEKIKNLIKNLKISRLNSQDGKYLLDLEKEINRAEVVEPKNIPDDIITMNSKIEIKDLDSGEEMVYTLVFPENADISQDKISILAPIGTALIGYKVGDTIEWTVPSGLIRLKVKKILYQPEAMGDFHL